MAKRRQQEAEDLSNVRVSFSSLVGSDCTFVVACMRSLRQFASSELACLVASLVTGLMVLSVDAWNALLQLNPNCLGATGYNFEMVLGA